MRRCRLLFAGGANANDQPLQLVSAAARAAPREAPPTRVPGVPGPPKRNPYIPTVRENREELCGVVTCSAPPSPLSPAPRPPPQLTYDPTITTPKSNPVHHSFADGGKFFPLGGGTEAGVAALFPGGLSGGLKNDMRSRDAHTALVRPIGVTLVQHMEHWRRRSAVDLAKMGVTTLDVDGTAPYTPPSSSCPTPGRPCLRGAARPPPPPPSRTRWRRRGRAPCPACE